MPIKTASTYPKTKVKPNYTPPALKVKGKGGGVNNLPAGVIPENIALPPNRVDVILPTGQGANFPPQFTDENINNLGFGLINAAIKMA